CLLAAGLAGDDAGADAGAVVGAVVGAAVGAVVAVPPPQAATRIAAAPLATRPRALPSSFIRRSPPPGGPRSPPCVPGRRLPRHCVRTRPSPPSLLVDRTGESPRMLSIGFVEQRPRPLGPHLARAGDDRRHGPALHEELGGPGLDGIDDRNRAHG